jgi:hypothetical protein
MNFRPAFAAMSPHGCRQAERRYCCRNFQQYLEAGRSQTVKNFMRYAVVIERAEKQLFGIRAGSTRMHRYRRDHHNSIASRISCSTSLSTDRRARCASTGIRCGRKSMENRITGRKIYILRRAFTLYKPHSRKSTRKKDYYLMQQRCCC